MREVRRISYIRGGDICKKFLLPPYGDIQYHLSGKHLRKSKVLSVKHLRGYRYKADGISSVY